MKKSLIFILSVFALVFAACSDDDNNSANATSVAFSVPSLNLTENVTPIQVVFSSPTSTSGNLTISYTTTDVAYGTDFTTVPAQTGNLIVVPFNANVSSVSFNFSKLVNAIEGETKNVTFKIDAVSLANVNIAGNTVMQVNFNETASLGQSIAPEVGGPTQKNQVYIDLSSGAQATALRTSWDLGFYSGDDFRVALNSSLKMSAKQLATTNIDEIQVEDPSMIIGTGEGLASAIDNPSGIITGTVIAAISDNDADNKVYLINMGSNPSEVNPAIGSDGSAAGSSRGWKKVRILKSGNDYKIQYADINSTTHEEKTISKNSAYNFTFFSLLTKEVVSVEPQKNQWDINFTTFTNIVGGTTPYYYADYVLTNVKGGARSYQVLTTVSTYEAFTLASVTDANFTADQRNIGSNWRSTSVTGPSGTPISGFSLLTNRFYVIKDPAGNIYKLRFTGGVKSTEPVGERGYPTFEYALLQ